MVTGTIHFYLGAIRIAQLIQTRGLRGRPFIMRLQQLLPSPVIRSEWQIRGNFLTRAIARAAQVTTTTLSCCTNAELGEHTVCSSGLPCRHRSPSSMEYVRDEGG